MSNVVSPTAPKITETQAAVRRYGGVVDEDHHSHAGGEVEGLLDIAGVRNVDLGAAVVAKPGAVGVRETNFRIIYNARHKGGALVGVADLH